ncbi:retrovirus-related pol polyprotein from transposon TNT 1-94, partial [Tanacetum coccineum]
RMMLESVEHGPLDWPSIEVDGVTRLKKTPHRCLCSYESSSYCQGSMGTSPTTYASLPPEWSKFVTDVKVVKDLHTTNFHQLKAYLEQHDIHVNEVRIMRERNQDPLALIASHQNTLKSSIAAGTSGTRANILGTGVNNSGQQRVVKCFNCQGEGHMARQCLKPKRKRDATWFRDKVLLVEAQGSSKVLNEEELTFLADPRVAEDPVTQMVITHNAAYVTPPNWVATE